MNKLTSEVDRRVHRDDFLANPVRWLELARKRGFVTIIGDRGETRATISVPGARIRRR